MEKTTALPDDHHLSEERIHWVLQQFASLPDIQKTVIRMKHFDEMKSTDIAKSLNITPQKASYRYQAAVKNLKNRARHQRLLTLLNPRNWIRLFT